MSIGTLHPTLTTRYSFVFCTQKTLKLKHSECSASLLEYIAARLCSAKQLHIQVQQKMRD